MSHPPDDLLVKQLLEEGDAGTATLPSPGPLPDAALENKLPQMQYGS
ncbi:MAG: hypothetical protein ACE37N_13280 [Pseudohongiellaceae bacterium]